MSMMLKSADISVINEKMKTKKEVYPPLIEAFLNSGEQCCEVVNITCKKPATATLALNQAIKRMNIRNVKAHTVRNRVYLAKEISL